MQWATDKRRIVTTAAVMTVILVASGFLNTIISAPAAHHREWREATRKLPDYKALNPLLERAGQRRLVLLGEASHGTSEFYTYRTAISKRLIADHDFAFIAVEGDWVLCQILNSYILDLPDAPESPRQALLQFDRWPLWMWANEEIVELAEWLREWNDQQPEDQKIGFYGIDVYGIWDSLDAVLSYFRHHHPRLLPEVENLYQNLARHHGDGQSYTLSLARGGRSSEEDTGKVLEIITNLPDPATETAARHRFQAEQNAWVVKYAERHFRAMLSRGPRSWNQRVEHMKKTVSRLAERYGPGAKGIVWAHNTHIGDAGATTMALAGQTNIGRLAREKWGRDKVYAVGFGTYEGEVMAARQWEGKAAIMTVPQAMPGSLEALLAEIVPGNAFLLFQGEDEDSVLRRALPHRAIGVVYQPEREQPGNYVNTIVPERYDAFIFLRRTRPVRTLHENPNSRP